MTLDQSRRDVLTENLLTLTEPEQLFSGHDEDDKATYRGLAQRWHPDKATGDARVFTHVTMLYQRRAEKLAQHTWTGPLDLTLSGKHTYHIRALKSAPFPFGVSYITEQSVFYLFEPTHGILFSHAAHRTFHYASERMANEFVRYLPVVGHSDMLDDHRYLMRVNKHPALIRLRDAVEQAKGFEAVHVAWMVSRLLNIACYLSYAGIVHHDISLDTVFIHPAEHLVMLYGGWEYAVDGGYDIERVPRRTYGVMSASSRLTKRPSPSTDLELIRLTAREALGSHTAEKPMHQWLHRVGNGSARQQYAEWHEVLKATFGPRRFVHLGMSAEDVYSRSVTLVR